MKKSTKIITTLMAIGASMSTIAPISACSCSNEVTISFSATTGGSIGTPTTLKVKLGKNMFDKTTDQEITNDTYEVDTIYPGWEKGAGSEKAHSLAVKGFKMFGAKPEDADIHGGVEPAWWSGVYASLAADPTYKETYKDWSLTSYGATIKYCHNPKEEVFLDTLSPTIKTTLYLLENIGK